MKDVWSLRIKLRAHFFPSKEEPHFCKLTFFTHCCFHSLILDIGRPSFQVVNRTHEVSFSTYSSISSHLILYNNARYTRQGPVTYAKVNPFRPIFFLKYILKTGNIEIKSCCFGIINSRRFYCGYLTKLRLHVLW